MAAQDPTSLHKVISASTLRLLGGDDVFRRGQRYFEQGRVALREVQDESANAVVTGTEPYACKLKKKGSSITGTCTCPAYERENFCKHLVAVALAVIAPPPKAEPAVDPNDPRERALRTKPRSARTKPVSEDSIREFLSGASREFLVELILTQAQSDPTLKRRLVLKTAKAFNNSTLSEFRSAITEATRTSGFVDYREACSFVDRMRAVADDLAEALDHDSAKEVRRLTEYFLARVEKAIGEMDDSDGHAGSILEILQDLHLKACELERPDTDELAETLFQWELRSDFDLFAGSLDRYSDVLGVHGKAKFRKLAESLWEKLPSLGPKDQRQYSSGRSSLNRFALTRIMELIARQEDDLELWISIQSKDLSSPYQHLQIAERLRAEGKNDEALQWALKGIKDFPRPADSRIRSFLCALYAHLDKKQDAVAMAWEQFTENASLEHYRSLRIYAEQVQAWEKWRKQAYETVVALVRKGRPENRCSYEGFSSVLISMYLDDKEFEAGWAAAKKHGCSETLWHKLAKLREKDHPADSIEIYRKAASNAVARTSNGGYHEAVEWIEKIQRLMSRAEFSPYVDDMRKNHKAKRNFIKLLDARF